MGLSLLPYEPDPTLPTLSVVANGVVRNGFTQGQQISFADMYSVLPLGMTLEDPLSIENSAPGYPLVKVYLTGAEIKNMAQLISYVIAAGDTDFVSALGALDASEAQMRAQLLQLAGGLNSGSPIDIATYTAYVAPATDQLSIAAQTAYSTAKTNGADDSAACQAAAQVFAVYALTNAGDGSKVLQLVLPNLGSDYFLHASGVQYTHTGSAGRYLIDPASVNMYANTDIKCANAPTAVVDETYYPVIVDIYVVLMMQDPLFITLLSGLGIPVIPTNIDGTENIDVNNIMDYAITTDGTTEIKEWQALLTYLTSDVSALGLGGMIPDSAYGSDAINATTGYTSRVNQP